MKSIKITIPEPCHEDWGEMTQQDKGKFCSSCKKVVYDMSVMTDNEIIKLIEADDKVCGRFKNDQLNRSIEYTVPLRTKKPSWAIAASLLVGLTFLSCSEEPVAGGVQAVEAGAVAVVDTLEASDGADTLDVGIQCDSSNVKGVMVGNIKALDDVPKEIQVTGMEVLTQGKTVSSESWGQPVVIEERPLPIETETFITAGVPAIEKEIPDIKPDTSNVEIRTSGWVEIEKP
jgi:hypothetical protein